MKINLCEKDIQKLIDLANDRNVYLEGNIIKLIDPNGNESFASYLQKAKEEDHAKRKKRLEVTKEVQVKNKELMEASDQNETLMIELKEALSQAEGAKQAALDDLDLMQKKTQFELIGNIVKVALWVIMGVGLTTTALYAIALFTGNVDTTLLGNTWSNLFGILLTNSFSIIGTIMGVKYASEKEK